MSAVGLNETPFDNSIISKDLQDDAIISLKECSKNKRIDYVNNENFVDDDDDDGEDGEDDDDEEEGEDDAGSLVDFVIPDDESDNDDDDNSSTESESPKSKEDAINRDMCGIDTTNIILGKRTRRQTQFYEKEVFNTDEYKKMMLCDIPKDEMHAVVESDDSDSTDESNDDVSFIGNSESENSGSEDDDEDEDLDENENEDEDSNEEKKNRKK
jgi:hypothetical protein